jgi:hypothetical protein
LRKIRELICLLHGVNILNYSKVIQQKFNPSKIAKNFNQVKIWSIKNSDQDLDLDPDKNRPDLQFTVSYAPIFVDNKILIENDMELKTL